MVQELLRPTPTRTRRWTPESAGNKQSEVSKIIAQAEKEKVRFVNLQFTDLMGIVKSVAIPLHQFEDACISGKWFDGSSIEGFARIAESDMFLVPDLSTWAIMPWERADESTARAICWVYNPNGDLFEGDPRMVLARAMDYAANLGYKFNTGPELEFFLFKDTIGDIASATHDVGGYFDLTGDMGANVRKDMVNALEGMGIKVETSHHEVARGQHEIDFEYDNALSTADNAVTLKYTLKAIAATHGLHATFMPKPIFGINGSGMHTHQSFSDIEGEHGNLFANEDDPDYGLSTIAKKYIAGQLKHARGMCAVLAPLVNSYKRLVPGYEAPVYISWARVNRSALIRVPKNRPGKTAAARIELRCPDPTCNPYLAFAVMVRAGLDGIENDLDIPDPVEENLYHFDENERRRRNIQTLPGSLHEALGEMEKCDLVRETLGDHITDRLLEAKTEEWNEFRMRVTQWELDRYLDMY
ncbi:MAG: type I glutamate--ammonia ligase [Chloroflexia bacterium]